MNKEEKELSLRVDLNEPLTKAFKVVKEELMLENNSEVMRTLIREKYKQILKEEQAADF